MRIPRRLFPIAACALAGAALWAGELADRLDERVNEAVKAGRFSGAVLVARDGKVLLSKGYGLANAELGAANTPQTKFRIGSMTKQFTAMALMLLEEKGKLKTSDPVCRFVTECPEAWRNITIHHLLTHTSGIPSFTSFPDYAPTMSQRSPVSRTVERFKNKPLVFEPGSKWEYSNSGYVLLGYILEKVAGEDYGAFLQRNIFEPLGMSGTGYDDSTPILQNRASGYSHRAGHLVNASYIDMTVPHAAGALYSTVEDLYRWDQALSSGKLVSKQSMERIFMPFQHDYAYGWFVTKRKNHRTINHGGGINGFSSMIDRYPDDKLTVIVLCNFDDRPAAAVATALADLVLGERH